MHAGLSAKRVTHGSQTDSPSEEQQQPQHQKGRHGQQGAPPFEGDVSEWGKTQLDSYYDSEIEPEVSGISSGISPRDMRPRVRPFYMQEATETLAYQSGMFSRAQALRRDGCAPAAMGVPDDLPTRMAYQQLNILAGMAGKVQDAILHNKRIFEQRMMAEGKALQRRALHGWLVWVQQRAAKRAVQARAQGRLQRGLLLRVFFSWKDDLHAVDKTLVMKRKVAVATARGCVRRCFAAWLVLARERWWKTQMSSMESQVALLEAKVRGYEKRPIQVLRKRRLSQLLSVWLVEALWSQHKRRQVAKANCWCRQHMQQHAWDAWGAEVCEKARQRALEQRLVKNGQLIRQQATWEAWLQAIECKQVKQQQLLAAKQHYQHATYSKAWQAWHSRAKQHRKSRTAANRWKRPYMAKAFKFWLWYAGKQKQQKLTLLRAQSRRQRRLTQGAFSCWLEYVQQRHLKKQLGDKQSIQDELERLKAENARLFRDNERFMRLVDSGEWGRGRVAELTAAGELMRAERDALLKLVQALRREYEAVQLAKESQHDELRALKDKMTVKGAARNCLLVKGGSSFNALVRAMKQDLIDSGTAAKDPALLYQIDKLSMDRVHVYPDGELNIQAVTSGPQGGKDTTQQHSQHSSPQHVWAQSPHWQQHPVSSSPTSARPSAAGSTAAAAAAAAAGFGSEGHPRLRVAVGAYGSTPGSSTSSPTRFGRTGGAASSSPQAGVPSAAAPPRHPHGQRALSAVAAAAAAAAAAVVGSRGSPARQCVALHEGMCLNGQGPAADSPTQGHMAQQHVPPTHIPTDNMLQALSRLTPAQVQRLTAASQQPQLHAADARLVSTAPSRSSSSNGPAGSPARGRTGSSSSHPQRRS